MNNLQHLFDHSNQFKDDVVSACLACADTPCFANELEAFDYLMDDHEPVTEAEELMEVNEMISDVIDFLEGIAEASAEKLRAIEASR